MDLAQHGAVAVDEAGEGVIGGLADLRVAGVEETGPGEFVFIGEDAVEASVVLVTSRSILSSSERNSGTVMTGTTDIRFCVGLCQQRSGALLWPAHILTCFDQVPRRCSMSCEDIVYRKP